MRYSVQAKGYPVSQSQWQPTLTSHDPNPPITLEDAAAALLTPIPGSVFQDSVPRLRLRISSELFFVHAPAAAPETITLDKWFKQSEDPRRGPRQFQAASFFFTDSGIAETVTLDKWFRQSEEPRRRKRVEPGWNALVFVQAWGWLPEVQQQARVRLRTHGGSFLVEPVAETVTLDKWLSVQVHPRRQQRVQEGWISNPIEVPAVGTTWTSYGFPMLYTDADWQAGTLFYFEAYFRATSGTSRARLFNATDLTAVSGSEVSTTGTSLVRLRSGAISLTDGKDYLAQFGKDSGASRAFVLARVIAV